MVVFSKRCKNYNDIQLTKNKILKLSRTHLPSNNVFVYTSASRTDRGAC